MQINIIVAIGKNRVIGIDGDLPWKLSSDLKNFKEITMSKPIIMGRKTFESIGRALPGRRNIVLSSNPDYKAEDCEVFNSLERAVDQLEKEDVLECMIIGGARLYKEAIPYSTRIFLTEVDASPKGDVFFPKLDDAQWEEVDRENHQKDDKNDYNYSFVILEKK